MNINAERRRGETERSTEERMGRRTTGERDNNTTQNTEQDRRKPKTPTATKLKKKEHTHTHTQTTDNWGKPLRPGETK